MTAPERYKRIETWLRDPKVRRVLWVLLGAGMLCILYVTVLKRSPFEGKHLQLQIFWSYSCLEKEWKQMLGNVLMFIPVGFLHALLDKKTLRVLLTSALFSILIELLQYCFRLGLCEFDDVFHNLLGTAIGAGSVILFRRKMKKVSD